MPLQKAAFFRLLGLGCVLSFGFFRGQIRLVFVAIIFAAEESILFCYAQSYTRAATCAYVQDFQNVRNLKEFPFSGVRPAFCHFRDRFRKQCLFDTSLPIWRNRRIL